MNRSHTTDRGSAAVELVLLTPLLVVLLLFVAFAGRVTRAQATVRAAAGAAARSASLRQSPAAAESDARSTATAHLARAGLSCVASGVTVDASALRPGGQVQVTVRCEAALDDLGLLGVPGRRSFSATAVEVVDARRGG